MTQRILGYSDRISACPGETIQFKVSAPQPGSFRAELVRVVCGDDQPDGPGLKLPRIPSAIDGNYPARHQPIPFGSSIAFAGGGPQLPDRFTLAATIWPTWLGKGAPQAILGRYEATAAKGCALYLDEMGALAARFDGQSLTTGIPLHERRWFHVALSFDRASGTAKLHQLPLDRYALDDRAAATSGKVGRLASGPAFRIAAWEENGVAAAHFNGKIEGPLLIAAALEDAAIRQALVDPKASGQPLLAAWDFAREMSGEGIDDASGHGHRGRCLNLPARAMKGWRWDASEMDWTKKPDHYAAIHFHDDDLYDCGWQTDFSLTVPADLKSGVYAVRIAQSGAEGDDLEDFMPFAVRPPRGVARAPLCFLLPTASYWAYANQQMPTSWNCEELVSSKFTTLGPVDRYLEENLGLGLSTYDLHNDGSGVCYASRLRPILNMRPKADLWQFNADTHILDWLEAKGIAYDVVTDDDLEAEGLDLLTPYRCVMTGTHPEYYSNKMLDAVQSFTDRGGRLIYMGANGFYWRIAYHPTLPGVIEHRRAEDGMRGWLCDDGEYYMSFTGELGGLWRRNGRAPNKLVGTGFAAQGFDHSIAYRRLPASFDPRAAFIFEGVGADEPIGDFGLLGGGAAGWEIDRADRDLGTPPHCLILAVADQFSAGYHWVKEEFNHSHAAITGETCPFVRCDMTYFETPMGGAVFSTSSISWGASLPHNGYDNNVSRITENLVRRFCDPQPL